MRGGRRATLFAMLAGVTVGTGACAGGSGESEYYQAYLAATAELDYMGAQLDSTLIRIRDLEEAVTAANAELASAQASVTDAELFVERDPPSAVLHARQAGEQITRARSLLEAVAP